MDSLVIKQDWKAFQPLKLHNQYEKTTWLAQDLFMTCTWLAHDLHMACVWLRHKYDTILHEYDGIFSKWHIQQQRQQSVWATPARAALKITISNQFVANLTIVLGRLASKWLASSKATGSSRVCLTHTQGWSFPLSAHGWLFSQFSLLSFCPYLITATVKLIIVTSNKNFLILLRNWGNKWTQFPYGKGIGIV